MATRRNFLKCLTLAPLAARIPLGGTPVRRVAPRVEIWHEDHCLSRESADGFQFLLSGTPTIASRPSDHESSAIIIVPGMRNLSAVRCSELLQRARDGAWLILETGSCFLPATDARRQATILENTFDFGILPPVPISKFRTTAYIQYSSPIRRLVRTFGAITPIRCHANESIAVYERHPVCLRKRIGQGGLFYLGTMLGPGLFAEEREAQAIGAAIMRSLNECGS